MDGVVVVVLFTQNKKKTPSVLRSRPGRGVHPSERRDVRPSLRRAVAPSRRRALSETRDARRRRRRRGEMGRSRAREEGEKAEEEEDAMAPESDESGGSESDGDASGSASSSDEGFDDDAFVVDEEESEEEDDEEEDDEESEEEDALERPVSNQMVGMSRAFQSLVGDGEEATEMLPKSRKQLVDGLEAKAEEKERRANKRAKLELKHRGHVKPQPRGQNIESDMLERRLHNTATKGVVRLF